MASTTSPATHPGAAQADPTESALDPSPTHEPPTAAEHARVSPRHRKWPWIAAALVFAAAAVFVVPWAVESFRTVSTDDAYVNGHVTFVAPRVAGQVSRVLVDDNNVVKKGDLLVELDPEPFR